MAILCGNGGHYHDTTGEVRACYAKKYAQATKTVVATQEKKPTHLDCSKVPAGSYALEIGGKLHFFEVKVGTGRWSGYRFVEELYGAPGDWRRTRLLNTAQLATLRRILNDEFSDLFVTETGPKAGAARFGKHFTICARCKSPLSDETSRARGLGPDCVKHFG
jgi:hypothetical protein